MDIRKDAWFKGIEPFEKKIWLASPTMHGDEQRWVDEAIVTQLYTCEKTAQRLRNAYIVEYISNDATFNLRKIKYFNPGSNGAE